MRYLHACSLSTATTPVVTECPPPPSPPSPPPPSPPPPPNPSPPPPACPSCASPCSSCRPPPCSGCPSPPKQVVPYFIYSYKNPPPSESAATNAHSLLVSATLVILWGFTKFVQGHRSTNLLSW
ncbi:hypothetical protein ERO13_A11G111800v2 [Gossypium hirsutum]|uniref:Sulfated surface glycoprotein 185 n=1 Tax=Gossypium hirsutum TaxID=3635 RepID=A0A1U8L2Q8_GOSHI|nr:sulfated surface glycoprotein 185-like [Gossypium hirsutum]KAG4174300.1 hypothetical protein ERO13_A11G111800v2 [Gossypium hirsutum]